MDPVTDLRDVRVMIPRVKRAIYGPSASAAVAADTMTDDQATAWIADAVADIIFYSGGDGVFGHTLEVTARDTAYLAPIAWQTDTELTLPEQTVIIAQAAINFFIHVLDVTLKVKETIRDEGQEWSYEISANLLRDRLKELIAARDKALEQVTAQNPSLDSWVSFLHERDGYAAALIEPFTDGARSLGGMELLSYRSGWEPY